MKFQCQEVTRILKYWEQRNIYVLYQNLGTEYDGIIKLFHWLVLVIVIIPVLWANGLKHNEVWINSINPIM